MDNVNAILKNQRFIALDIETTGGTVRDNRVIELGVVEWNEGKFVREYSKIFGGGKSQYGAYKVHGISDKSREGLETFEQAAFNVKKFLSNAILIGHNISAFDLRVIRTRMALDNLDLENFKLIDTLKILRKNKDKIAGLEGNKLEQLTRYFGIEAGGHRALGDARATLTVFDKIIPILGLTEEDIYSDYPASISTDGPDED